jgi:AraC-like DNA-binding protein
VYTVDEVRGSTSGTDWVEAFRELHGAHDVLRAGSGEPRSGGLTWQRSDRYRLAWCGGAQHSVTRGSKHVRADPRAAYELLIPLRGRAVVSAGGTVTELAVGSAALCDLDRPLSFSHGADFESIALVVPQAEVVNRETRLTASATVIDTTEGLGALVRQLAVGLHGERGTVDQRAFDASCDGLLDLAVLAGTGADSAPDRHQDSVADSVRHFVAAHAHEHDLDVRRIARAVGWSPRHVQAVLQSSGTTARDLIRDQRLELAKARLLSPGWADVTVADIASASGLSSHSLFTAAFRAKYGTTPTAARRAGSAAPPGDRGDYR